MWPPCRNCMMQSFREVVRNTVRLWCLWWDVKLRHSVSLKGLCVTIAEQTKCCNQQSAAATKWKCTHLLCNLLFSYTKRQVGVCVPSGKHWYMVFWVRATFSWWFRACVSSTQCNLVCLLKTSEVESRGGSTVVSTSSPPTTTLWTWTRTTTRKPPLNWVYEVRKKKDGRDKLFASKFILRYFVEQGNQWLQKKSISVLHATP